MKLELKKTIDFIGQEKNLSREQLFEAIKVGLLSAAEKKYGPCDFEVNYLAETDEFELFRYRRVVEDSQYTNPCTQIAYSEAKKLDPSVRLGDEIGDLLSTEGLGRIAAQFAKKRVMQKISEAEKNTVFQEFSNKKGELVVGTVRRFDEGDIIVDLGHSEALLPYKEQIPGERLRYRDRVTAYVLDVKRYTRGPQITLSRTHPGMLSALFAQEVAEVRDGTIEIKAVARIPGKRAKVAVWSDEPSISPVGACIGVKGVRIQNIIQELNGEQIDVIQYDEDPARFVCNALTPAEVSRIFIYDHLRLMEVIIDDDQLSLAIGKKGQNVSLASTLTGWKIDIRSQSRLKELIEEAKQAFAKIKALDPLRSELLINEGYRTLQDISKLSIAQLIQMLNVSEEQAQAILDQTHEKLLNEYTTSSSTDPKVTLSITSEIENQLVDLIAEEIRQKERPTNKISSDTSVSFDERLLKKYEKISLENPELSEAWRQLRGVNHVVAGWLIEKRITEEDFLTLDSSDLRHKLSMPHSLIKRIKADLTSRQNEGN